MIENSTYEIALKLYNLACDMDFMDYDEVKDKTIEEIEACIYYIYAAAQNPYNAEYFRTFIKCLDAAIENI